MGVFSSFGREVETGGGFELGEGRRHKVPVLQLLGGREAVTGCHVVGAVTIAMLHCISKPNEE